MTGYERVFLDTTPLIYFLDHDEHFGDRTRRILEEILGAGKAVVSSAITCMEYLIYPYRNGNQEKIDVFFEFVRDCDIPLTPVNSHVARTAAQIRAKYRHFKAMDALQLAVALETNCDVFLTNDNQLRQFEELRCVTVEDWPLT